MEQHAVTNTGGSSCTVAMGLNHSKRVGSENVSYHYFSKSEALRSIWLQCCRRENPDGTPWIETSYCILCSQHFVLEDYRTVTKAGKPMERRLLHLDVVPLVFQCLPSHLRSLSFKAGAIGSRLSAKISYNTHKECWADSNGHNRLIHRILDG